MKIDLKLICLGIWGCLMMNTYAMAQGRITPSMIQKAKAMGATDAQIQDAISGTRRSNGSTDTLSFVNKQKFIDRNKMEVDSLALDTSKLKNIRPLKDTIPKNLVFGREIFSSKNLTFAPNYNIPTPPTYVLGPGDEILIEVWGESESSIQQKISPEGTINVTGVGPITLSGFTVAEAQSRIQSRIGEIMNGQVKVSLGAMRSIKVNISGEVDVPGTYTLPALATLFNALYSAGGVNDIGSLRHIQVFRNSKMIADLDVYDYLINGKYETNIRLEDNDMIIIPPYDNHVTITGKVKRNRIYELKPGETLDRLISYGGGFTGDAYTDNITVNRKSGRTLSIRTVSQSDFNTFSMLDGDSVLVEAVIPIYSNLVSISGAVWRPGNYELSDQILMLSQLIAKAEGLKGSEFASRGQLLRTQLNGLTTMIPFNVRDVAEGKEDIPLNNLDQVYIPNLEDLKENYYLIVKGEVNRPDTLMYNQGMTIEDAILLSGGLRESASLSKVEIARRIKNASSTSFTPKIAETFSFNISEDLKIAPEQSRFPLEPFDEVYIRRSPGYSDQNRVFIEGEVLFDGEYVLATTGDRVSDVIKKAGGLTPEAYVKGASLQRHLSEDDRAKVAALMQISQTNKGKDSLSTQTVIIPEFYPIGIDVVKAMKNPGGGEDIILQHEDRIFIPKLVNTVSISGAVVYPNTVVYDGDKLKDYISQAGGYKQEARKRPFVIYMNGKVASTRGGKYPKIEPGCQIVVPLKKERTGNGLATAMGLVSSTASLAAIAASIASASRR